MKIGLSTLSKLPDTSGFLDIKNNTKQSNALNKINLENKSTQNNFTSKLTATSLIEDRSKISDFGLNPSTFADSIKSNQFSTNTVNYTSSLNDIKFTVDLKNNNIINGVSKIISDFKFQFDLNDISTQKPLDLLKINSNLIPKLFLVTKDTLISRLKDFNINTTQNKNLYQLFSLNNIEASKLFESNKLLSISDSRNFIRFSRNPTKFKTFIKINVKKAIVSELSYFKTITINKFENNNLLNIRGYNNSTQTGYKKLINDDNTTINFNNFFANNSNNLLDVFSNSIKGVGLGRNLNLPSKTSDITRFSLKNSYTYNFGLTLNQDLKINEIQEILFECSNNVIMQSNGNEQQTQLNEKKHTYDLYLIAYNIRNEIIEVLNLGTLNTLNVNWGIDNKRLLNIDDVDFDKLLNIQFDSQKYNNLNRKININLTSYGKSILKDVTSGEMPIESVSVFENEENETHLNQVNIKDLGNNTLSLICNKDLTFSITNPFRPIKIDYKFYFKIAGSNQYFIKNATNYIDKFDNSSLKSIGSFITQGLNCQSQYIINESILKIDLSLIGDIPNYFNPNFLKIFINNNQNNNYIDKIYIDKPAVGRLPDFNLLNSTLRNFISNQNRKTFYLLLNERPENITFMFEQNYENYLKSFSIQFINETSSNNFNQSLELKKTIKNEENFSNLNVMCKYNLNNIFERNNNFNRYISLNYTDVFLENLRNARDVNITENFESSLYILVKKSVKQAAVKDTSNRIITQRSQFEKFYLFQQDKSTLTSKYFSFSNDFNNFGIKLDFNDDEEINKIFSNQSESITTSVPVEYEFFAKILIIPISFFSINNKNITLNKIRDIIGNNKNISKLSPRSIVNNIFNTLNNINKQSFNLITNLDFMLLYEYFCFNDSEVSNKILLENTSQENIVMSNRNIHINFSNNTCQFLKTTNEYYASITCLIDNQSDISNLILNKGLKSGFNNIENLYCRISGGFDLIFNKMSILQNTYRKFLNDINQNISYEFVIDHDSLKIIILFNITTFIENTLMYIKEKLNKNEIYFKINLNDILINNTSSIIFNNNGQKEIFISFAL